MRRGFTVFECDYHERTFKIGEYGTLKEAREAARTAFKKSKREFPVFIMSGRKCVADYR